MSDPLSTWIEKKLFLEIELAKTSDASQKFTLIKDIQNCDQNIARLQVQQPNTHTVKSFLEINSSVIESSLNYPPKTNVFGIEWDKNYTDVRLNLLNSSNQLIENIDLLIQLDTQIADIKQTTNIPNVIISPTLPPISLLVLNGLSENNEEISFPVTSNPISHSYKIHCPKLPTQHQMNFVIASIAINPAVNGELPKQLFAPKQLPNFIKITASFYVPRLNTSSNFSIEKTIRLTKDTQEHNSEIVRPPSQTNSQAHSQTQFNQVNSLNNQANLDNQISNNSATHNPVSQPPQLAQPVQPSQRPQIHQAQQTEPHPNQPQIAIPEITFNNPKIIDIGVSELRALIPTIEILLLTVNDWERKALLSEMTPIDGKDGILQGALDRLTYHIGMFGNYCAAYTESTMGSGGRHGATLIAKTAVDELKPKAVLLLGIAFGIDSNKQKLGDVLIAESIQPYEFQKVHNDFSITYRGQATPCGNILSERFRVRRNNWVPKHGDKSFDDVKVHQGLVLSGDKLVNNKDFRDALVKAFPTSIGGEMEGAGAYSAVNPPTEVILIKSICDWADGDKNDKAQPFAAFTATSLAKHILSKPDVLHPLVNSNSQSQQDAQTYLNSTTVNPVASHINKTTNAINSPSINPKYSDQLIQLLKQKFDSLINKETKQFLLGLEDFLNFISLDNSPIHIITSKLQNELVHQHNFIKNQFEIQKNKTIEIKNKLIEQYPEIDDSDKDLSDFDNNFGSPYHYACSFQQFNQFLVDTDTSSTNYLTQLLYESNLVVKNRPVVDHLIDILRTKMEAYGIPSSKNPLTKDFDQLIRTDFLDLEQDYNQTYKNWQHYFETSPSTALFRLKYIVSMINPNYMKESEFKELITIEQSRYLTDSAVAALIFGWVKDILNQQNVQNPLNYSTNNHITSLKKDLEQVYSKIYEEMVLANHQLQPNLSEPKSALINTNTAQTSNPSLLSLQTGNQLSTNEITTTSLKQEIKAENNSSVSGVVQVSGSIHNSTINIHTQPSKTSNAINANQNNSSLLPILEARKQNLIDDIAAAYKQLGASLSEVDKTRINRLIASLESELTQIEIKISRSN